MWWTKFVLEQFISKVLLSISAIAFWGASDKVFFVAPASCMKYLRL